MCILHNLKAVHGFWSYFILMLNEVAWLLGCSPLSLNVCLPEFWTEEKLLVSSLSSKLCDGSLPLIALWALNLHQRFHLSSRLIKLDPPSHRPSELLPVALIPKHVIFFSLRYLDHVPAWPYPFFCFIYIVSPIHCFCPITQFTCFLSEFWARGFLLILEPVWLSHQQRTEPLRSSLFLPAFDTTRH